LEIIDAGDPPGFFFNLFAAVSAPFPLELALAMGGIIFLLLLSALVSGAEAAFFSLSPAELEACRHQPKRAYQQITALLQHPRRLLTTLLVFDSLINIGLVIIAMNLTQHFYGNDSLDFVTILALSLGLTIAIAFFGDVLPKIRARQNSLKTARRMAGVVQAAGILFYPLVALLLGLSHLIERRMRNKPGSAALAELQSAIDASITEESSPGEKEILKGIINFSSTTAKQIMRSRVDISAISLETGFPELLRFINQEGYSRIPAYGDTIDQIEGILYIKDLLPYLDAAPDFNWQQLLRPPYFVPEGKKIDDLLREFQDRHVHMAIVVDEYGGTAGLLTFEDIIEEIVGEINDEFDEEKREEYAQVDENTYIFEGQTSLHELSRVTGIPTEILDQVRKSNESVGGLMLELFEKIPQDGEEIDLDRYRFVIEAADHKRVKRVKVYVDDQFENPALSG
jgi:putative hemolysin